MHDPTKADLCSHYGLLSTDNCRLVGGHQISKQLTASIFRVVELYLNYVFILHASHKEHTAFWYFDGRQLKKHRVLCWMKKGNLKKKLQCKNTPHSHLYKWGRPQRSDLPKWYIILILSPWTARIVFYKICQMQFYFRLSVLRNCDGRSKSSKSLLRQTVFWGLRPSIALTVRIPLR
jgi:hypothetical protein